jgi:hypothetical protein
MWLVPAIAACRGIAFEGMFRLRSIAFRFAFSV